MIEIDYERSIFTVQNDDLTLTVEKEPFPINPRSDDLDNTTMLLWNFDFEANNNPYKSMSEFLEALDEDCKMLDGEEIIMLPIYFDSDACTVSHKISDGAENSRVIGFIYMTGEEAALEYDDEDIVKACRKQLVAEIQEYNDFVNGNLYGFTITRYDDEEDDDEIIDGGGNFRPGENILDMIKEMSDCCDDENYHLFEMLIGEMENNTGISL